MNTSPDATRPLAGRRALVTGASRGIGAEVAVALARAGADVGVVARSDDGLQRTAGQIRALSQHAAVSQMDVTQQDSVTAAVDSVVDQLGGIDILVNNSGILTAARLLDSTLEDWDRVFDTNLRGIYLCCRAVGPHLTAQGSGKVINIASSFGLKAASGFTAYCASKAGILHFTKALALEWARDGIQVNAVAPGYVVTELNLDIRSDAAFEQKVLGRIPTRRMAEPAEIAAMVVFLSSDAANYMTGSTVVIDGGQSL